MADDDWESRNFEEEDLSKLKAVKPPGKVDKWDGEDEEEPVKDNWDDDEEAKSAAAPGGAKSAAEAKKKKRLQDAIAEKERKAELQRLERARANMTPEELAAEKIRQQKLQEEVELAMVKSTFGSNEVDVVDPMTKDDFDALRKKIIGDLRKFEKRVPFEDFLEDFIQDLCLSLPSKRLKKVKATVEALYFEKNKAEKATTATKGKRTGGKVKLTVESDITNVEVGYELDDYDDFM
ncbi:eukaryotic translation initiation factor 3 subunit J [Folsomia candida]|uniref:Eukaryotic translation initiation factor 3 subunit J n=1 Tax=Folsomia candida TaxID=158441 RepID=A0A226E069_FOLCA|nr:eukaryotic translation initiation factor 3 subunit J [Folsomia candida]OXA50859.1 Eukaryotic translation initiation factor 3 subunit J [Folsomia candida]